jgi:hypothetical protein
VQLVVTGDRAGNAGFELGAVLWCVPFRGWSREHRLLAAEWCVPRRYLVRDTGGRVLEAGRCFETTVWEGSDYRIVVQDPALSRSARGPQEVGVPSPLEARLVAPE